jgi:hypothetical protein
MFGMSYEELVQSYGPESANQKLCGSPEMLVMSILSDAQETLLRVPDGVNPIAMQVRHLLNRAKWVLAQRLAQKAEAADKAVAKPKRPI